MALVTQAAFAKLHKVTRKTVTKWKAADLLVFQGSEVDIAASDALLSERGLGRFAAAAARGAKGNKAATTVAEEPVPFHRTPGEFTADFLAGRFARTSDAERVKENALALKHIIAARRDAGEVIDTGEAETIAFEMAREDRDAWLNWPTRIAPLLAADLGVKPEVCLEHLKGYVQQHLDERGEPEVDFKPKR